MANQEDYGAYLRQLYHDSMMARFEAARKHDIPTILRDCAEAAKCGKTQLTCTIDTVEPQEAYCESICAALQERQLAVGALDTGKEGDEIMLNYRKIVVGWL